MRTVLFVCGALVALLSSGAALCDGAFEQALSLSAGKRYQEAREVLDPLLLREPGNPRARLLHGILRAREGRVGEAIEVFETLRNDFPDLSEPYNNLAVLHAVEGRLDDAREILLGALERGPDPIAWANLGDVYTKLAQHAYEQARALEADGGARPERKMDTTFAIPATPDAPSPAASSRSGGPEPPPAAGEAARTFPAAPETAPVVHCTRIGGFRSRRAVAVAALWLQSNGAEVIEVRHEERQVASSTRVYLPPFGNPEEAVAKLREIRGRGVRDVAIIDEGELAGGISFGMYRKTENLHRRVAALGRLGYAVQSKPASVETVEEYALEAHTDMLDPAWKSRFQGHSIRVVGCG